MGICNDRAESIGFAIKFKINVLYLKAVVLRPLQVVGL